MGGVACRAQRGRGSGSDSQRERERESPRAAAETERGGGEKTRRRKAPPPLGEGVAAPAWPPARPLPSGRTIPATPPPTLTHLTAPANQLRGGREAAEGASPAANQRWGRAGPLAASLGEGGGTRVAAPSTAGVLKGTAWRGATRRGPFRPEDNNPPTPAPVNGFKGSSALLKGSFPRPSLWLGGRGGS